MPEYFAKANLDWDLIREPEPVEAGDALIFPEFAVVHRRDRSTRFLLEIVGFWTSDYLQEKLDRLRRMPCDPLVLCIDRGLNCSQEELPSHARSVKDHTGGQPEDCGESGNAPGRFHPQPDPGRRPGPASNACGLA
jgi:predicted nuclease of restriction endonuclease-like RecB superfamily